MTANLAGRVQTPVGLTANGDQEVYKDKPLFKIGALGNIPYDTLCIKADFKCMLQNYLIRSGNYGLRLIITTTKEVVDISLDSAKDMFGNPYGFITYFTQQQTYHLNLTGPIKGIAGYFYQRSNFTYYDDAEEFDLLVPVNNAPNIFIDNIEVYFGYDVSRIEDNTVQIYSYESKNYTSDGSLNKSLNLIWYNKTEDDKYLGFTDGTFNEEKAKSEPDPEDTNIYYWIEWYRDNNDGTWPMIISGNESVSSIVGECHDLYGQTQFKARIYCNGTYYESNVITFINQTLSNADSINALNLALLLHHGDSSEEAYPYYGNDNTLINVGDASRQRSLWFSYESTIGAILEPSVLNDAQVFWYISNAATMLTPGDNKTLTKVETGSEFEKYIEPGFDCFTKKLAADAETGPTQEDKTFKYKIKRVFNANNVKNIIKLKIVDKNGHEYLAEQKFFFSTAGTCGTDYSLVISEKNGLLAYYDDADYALEVKLYDGDFQDVSPEGLSVNAYNVPKDAFDYQIATAKAQVEWAGNKVTIDAQYPIAWSDSAQYYYQGPTNIVYNSSGVNPTYYNGELAIFDNNNHKIQGVTWKMHYSQEVDDEVLHYLPFVHFNSIKNYYYIKAANMFMHDIDINITLVAYQQDRPIWGQPLLIYQNQYASSLLNNWGGELKIDEKNNYLLSAMIGAGKKNKDNTFSGVLMGEVGAKTGDTSMGTIGLYGVHEGEQSFGLKIDGAMFLGKSGRGQIVFDGNQGTIRSGNYIKKTSNTEGAGMLIDLEEGHIDAYNFLLTSKSILLNANPENNMDYYFKVGDNYYISFTKGGVLDLNIFDISLDVAGTEMSKEELEQYRSERPKSLWLYINDEDQLVMDAVNVNKKALEDAVIQIETTLGAEIGSERIGQYQVWNSLTVGGSNLGMFPVYKTADGVGSTDVSQALLGEDGKTPLIQELYLNATYITTGVLASKDINLNDMSKSSGVYFDLDEGLLWASKFNLLVSGEKTIILSSDPQTYEERAYYFYIGNERGYIGYDTEEGVDISANSFRLDALSVDTTNNAQTGLYLNSSPAIKGNYLYAGDSAGGYISLIKTSETTNTLKMHLSDFHLSAKNNSTTLFLSNTPMTMSDNKTQCYFFIGNGNSGESMYYTTDGKLNLTGSISATRGKIGGWSILSNRIYGTWEDDTGTYYLNLWSAFPDGSVGAASVSGLSSRNWRIQAGQTSDGYNFSNGFGVTREGEMAANKGKIGGWNISSDGFMSNDKTVGLSSTSGYSIWAGSSTPASAPFSVTDAGKLTASSGTIGGLTISGTQYLDSLISNSQTQVALWQTIDGVTINKRTLLKRGCSTAEIDDDGYYWVEWTLKSGEVLQDLEQLIFVDVSAQGVYLETAPEPSPLSWDVSGNNIALGIQLGYMKAGTFDIHLTYSFTITGQNMWGVGKDGTTYVGALGCTALKDTFSIAPKNGQWSIGHPDATIQAQGAWDFGGWSIEGNSLRGTFWQTNTTPKRQFTIVLTPQGISYYEYETADSGSTMGAPDVSKYKKWSELL